MSNESSGFIHKCTKCDKEKPFDEETLFCGRCGSPLTKLPAQAGWFLRKL
jgi:hypothetical protein